jgi:hypothetical protein
MTSPSKQNMLTRTSSQANLGQDGNQCSTLAFRPLGSVLPRPVFSKSPSPVKRRKKRTVSSLSNRSSLIVPNKTVHHTVYTVQCTYERSHSLEDWLSSAFARRGWVRRGHDLYCDDICKENICSQPYIMSQPMHSLSSVYSSYS